jgi:hypothetical protein
MSLKHGRLGVAPCAGTCQHSAAEFHDSGDNVAYPHLNQNLFTIDQGKDGIRGSVPQT